MLDITRTGTENKWHLPTLNQECQFMLHLGEMVNAEMEVPFSLRLCLTTLILLQVRGYFFVHLWREENLNGSRESESA